MYFEAVQWIKSGGAMPDDPRADRGAVGTTYSFRGDRLLLEPKEQVKARLGYSPDDADALALTFAQPVAGREIYYDSAMQRHTMEERAPPAGPAAGSASWTTTRSPTSHEE